MNDEVETPETDAWQEAFDAREGYDLEDIIDLLELCRKFESELAVYRMNQLKDELKSPDVSESVERLVGGLADGASAKSFDADELARGIKVEMEHTDDRKVAEEICKDHLSEDPQYYSKLKKVGL